VVGVWGTDFVSLVQVYLKVVAVDGTKILKIVTNRQFLDAGKSKKGNRDLTVRFRMSGVGLSMVGRDPEEGRREIGYLELQGLMLEYVKERRRLSLEVKVNAVQLDNHVNKAIFPVIFCPQKRDPDAEFLHISLLADLLENGTVNVVR
jgi:hypothetical protein